MKPNYCPNCGEELKGENSTVEIQRDDESGYDCYCGWCKWSGDIWPGDETIPNTENEKGGNDGN